MYRTPTGTITTRNTGVIMLITTSPASRLKNQVFNIRYALGSRSSKASTSLENLFITLPAGVVSKNAMGDRITHFNMDEWSFPFARTIPRNPQNANDMTKQPENNGIEVNVYKVTYKSRRYDF